MAKLPKYLIQKYGISKKAWSVFRGKKSSKRAKPMGRKKKHSVKSNPYGKYVKFGISTLVTVLYAKNRGQLQNMASPLTSKLGTYGHEAVFGGTAALAELFIPNGYVKAAVTPIRVMEVASASNKMGGSNSNSETLFSGY